MSKLKEEYHFYLANGITITPQHVHRVPAGSRRWFEFIEDVVRYCCHRMELEVHVQQWVEDEWQGDGEKEAEDRQFKLADDYWKKWDALK